MPIRSRFFPAIFLITAVVPAAADPVTLVSATRFVQATATGACPRYADFRSPGK
jgi:hypothetical protein